ncbi:SWIM zinc finger family protein [Streptomyces sp. LRE541]|uniref:SWIM zinc finger family protein n=1 Tax=Streptomyces sp. LRE541 TaxID=2931983 RepID=UPI00200BB09E|nr:SWIM zinc finger family protein [Streptomyces sp. LRE541]UPZ33424.1 SWIM zinc finger family protein [Streptomyces sp. LRE541]
MSLDLPPVAPSVTAALVQGLTPRLRKRLDAGITKLADRPRVRDGDTVRIAVDDDTHLELHAPGGSVTSVDAIRCGCLLAPDCLHRAAAASAAPIAESEPEAAGEPAPVSEPGAVAGSDRGAGATPDTTSVLTAVSETVTPEQRAAALAMYDAAAAVLEAGTDGAGAVLQAELLRAAHTARVSGLPRVAASAVSVVTQLRAARDTDPAYRLTDLTAALRDVLMTAHRLADSTDADLADLRGSARQPYAPDGSLRLYGLFSEPVLTATGYAGAVTWTADADGRLYTVSDVAPGGSGRAVGAADRAVRVGDTALTHRELSRAGLAVSGATVSPTGRLGAGAGVRAVRAAGSAWSEAPLDRLWAAPVAEQVSRALRTGGDGLLFLDVTLVGTVREAAGDCLLADCDGLTLRLAAAHDHPALPYRDNLRLLATAPGIRLRVVARLDPAPVPRALLVATRHPGDAGAHVDLGLDRLQHADLPAAATASTGAAAGSPAAPLDEAPLHLLRRRVHQAASAGRRVLAFPGDSAADSRRLRRYGFACAGDLLDELHAAAADRSRDVFGRLVPADVNRFARAWLAAAHYTEEVDRELCAAAWGAAGQGGR